MKKYLFSLFVLTASVSFAVTINNGFLGVEVDGDGGVGSVVYNELPGSNNVSMVGVKLHYENAIHDTAYIQEPEKTYNLNQGVMFTGYGRDTISNFYVYSVSYLGTNSCMEQALVYTMRTSIPAVKFNYVVDSQIKQTKTNDNVTFNAENKALMFEEDSIYLGVVAKLNNDKTTEYTYGARNQIFNELDGGLPYTTKEQNYEDVAGAISWASSALDGTPVTVRTKIILAKSDPEIQSMTTFADNTFVHVPNSIMIEIKNAKFTQLFTKANKDKIKLKGSVNITEYGTALDNLNNLDVSVLIGDYIAFSPADRALKVKEKKIVYKIKDVKSVRKLIIKTKKKKGNKYLDFTFSASKTDIDGATSLSALSNSGKDIAIKLPVTIVLTGNNSNDTEKGGQVWIIPASVNMVYKKKKDTKATGKLQK